MATTVEELERRLTRVEQEVTRLRHLVKNTIPVELPSERGARLLGETRISQPEIGAAVASAFQEMGSRVNR